MRLSAFSHRFGFSLVSLFTLLTNVALAAPNTPYYQNEREEEKPVWQEAKVVYPELPQGKNLIPIYLNATSTNQFWVDRASVSVGEDGVVRYSLIVQSSGGVRGVSYEGIRCDSRELRRYAILRNETEWVRSRNENWSKITESPGHRQHAVLYLEHFCPNGIAAVNAAEAVRNLQRGGRSPLESPTQNY